MHHCRMEIGDRIGVVSDTHGLMREAVLKLLSGVNLIIHAGDVGEAEILTQLTNVAPVIAVRGNVDSGDQGADLPMGAWVDAEGSRIYVYHIVQDLPIDPDEDKVDMVISGHSHRSGVEEKNGVVYLNPGSVGPKRFSRPVSFAFVTYENDGLVSEICEIPD